MYSNIQEFYAFIDILIHRCLNATDNLRENLVNIRTDHAVTNDEQILVDVMLSDVFKAFDHLYHLRSLNNQMFVTDRQKGDTPHE